ncbi:hypothetical protein JR316_0011542 [Psilocybe cubensis]|uniref:Uncharacterized protein n=2 Tax=Psilocybe cubensis TaxID=181762 RepID=A0A8H7XUP6_PSICU|nr:hypothetical protein JR316_0011542 [Psilocybe cubensis]KAH9475977.1 hypothetical protein JR316_0011542 [Psilocybe cubensis]
MSSPPRRRISPVNPSGTAENLPPQRALNPDNKFNPLLRTVSPPLYNTRLSNLIYLLVGLTTLLTVFYGYRTMQYKTSVGGWWGLLLGKKPPEMQASGTPSFGGYTDVNADSRSIESHILALALALGIPSQELATAIASAVRSHVPPASLSSIKAHETGDAVKLLLQDPAATTDGGHGVWEAASTAAGVVDGVVSGMENFVGIDEP